MRIYLSKSNQAVFSVYSVVKQKLVKMGHEVVEHNGGDYDPSLLLSCDALLVLPGQHVLGEFEQMSPSKQATYAEPGDYQIGKGQYEQVLAFAKKNCNMSVDAAHPVTYTFGMNSIYIIAEVEIKNGHTSIGLDELDTLIMHGADWKKNYADWVYKGMTWNIDHMEEFQVRETTTTSTVCAGETSATTQPHLAIAPVLNIRL